MQQLALGDERHGVGLVLGNVLQVYLTCLSQGSAGMGSPGKKELQSLSINIDD